MVIKAKKIPPLIIREITPFDRIMGNPFLRFGLAGLSAIVITFFLFIFMIFITQNFDKYSDMASESLFSLNMVEFQNNGNKRRVRVQPPEEVQDQPAGINLDDKVPDNTSPIPATNVLLQEAIKSRDSNEQAIEIE